MFQTLIPLMPLVVSLLNLSFCSFTYPTAYQVTALAIDTLLAGAVIQRAVEDLKATLKISSSLEGRVGAVGRYHHGT